MGFIGYMLLVLTAMQVGLATDRLRYSGPFQNASYGFTAFSILAPLIILGLLILYMTLMVLFNGLYTWKHRRGQKRGHLQPKEASQS